MTDRGFYDKIRGGSVAEWLKAHDSKSCGPKGLGGSNPLASAILWLRFGVIFLSSIPLMRTHCPHSSTSLDSRVYNYKMSGEPLADSMNGTMELGVGTFALTDIRDNKDYLVRRLADGNCWMVQNLDLDLND